MRVLASLIRFYVTPCCVCLDCKASPCLGAESNPQALWVHVSSCDLLTTPYAKTAFSSLCAPCVASSWVVDAPCVAGPFRPGFSDFQSHPHHYRCQFSNSNGQLFQWFPTRSSLFGGLARLEELQQWVTRFQVGTSSATRRLEESVGSAAGSAGGRCWDCWGVFRSGTEILRTRKRATGCPHSLKRELLGAGSYRHLFDC